MSDTIETLGKILDSEQERDAVHIAVAPVIAAEKLFAGQEIGLNERGEASAQVGYIGIVDPFLKSPVFPGQRFWLWLCPGSITSLKHNWTHPTFGAPASTDSQKWIREFAEGAGLSYQVVLDGAQAWVSHSEYISAPFLEGQWVPDEFWPHYEKVSGTKVSEEDRGSFFTCSC